MSNPEEKEAPWRGDQWDVVMDGVGMDCPPQDLLNKIGMRGLQGWELCSSLPVPKPGSDPKDENVEMVWGMIYKRKKSALVRV